MAKRRKRITKQFVQATENDPPPNVPDVTVKPDVDDDAWDDDGLTMRQRSFVEAIVGPAGGNASKAAEMAGYAAENRNALKATASLLLTNANVQDAIARALARRKMTPEWAQERLVAIAATTMAAFVSVGDDGEPVMDWRKAAESGAIGQIREWREEGGKVGESLVVIKRSFKLHDQVRALETVLKLAGLLKDTSRVELTGPDGKPIQTETTHTFDHDRYRDLFQRRAIAGNGGRPAPDNGN